MKYPIKILQKQAEKHKQQIKELENVDHEMYSSMIFCEEEIKNHQECIDQLNKAIDHLRKL